MIYSLQLSLSIVLDALFGDPRWYPHPVRAIGWLCSRSERFTRRLTGNLYLAGLLTVLAVIGTTGAVVYFILSAAASVSMVLEGAVGIILLYTTIAARDLLRHSNEVYVELQSNGSLEESRAMVARIVGRDTKNLDEDGICRACIETVAENMVDGITAPLFFALLASFASPFMPLSPIGCSALGAFLYKAVNTMDSMIAYKNDKYLQFGRVAAKLDDFVNFIPARISGLCLIIAAIFLKLDYRNAAEVFRRDRLKHSSPNAGHTEATTAGALGIRLGGPSFYRNKVVEKPYMGDGGREPVPEDIKKTNRLIIAGSAIFSFIIITIRFVVL
jgi:adenosylcobinamide-phosphate synthase